ncbi:MAG: NAD(P)-dependent oxidoreductase, partial [Acidobacteriota bacterium]|jgi:nucleoside-diphosphate-sugar epimerase
VRPVFRRIAAQGGAEALIHLAAHYDFTGEDDPEYWRTNVRGLRHVLEGSRSLKLRRFIFASSLAACEFPPPGEAVTEETPPDAPHVYARTKAIGEGMLGEYGDSFPSVIVRFAALYSDWCEYPPLYHFLNTWLSNRWNARLLGGRGECAIPYLHVRDAAICLGTVVDRMDRLEPGEVLLASTDGAVSQTQLFFAATGAYFRESPPAPRFVPKILCRPGLWVVDRAGRWFGEQIFERPWMADYVDRKLTVDASRTCARLSWKPRPRLEILRRMPFLIENFRTDPLEWHRRNAHFMLRRQVRPNLRIYQLLLDHRERIVWRFDELMDRPETRRRMPHYQALSREERQWNHRQILRNLLHALRTRRKGLFMAYCRDLAERRARSGFEGREVICALRILHLACHEVLSRTEEAAELGDDLWQALSQTIRFGIDQVEMVYEAFQGRAFPKPTRLDLPGARDPDASGTPDGRCAPPPDPVVSHPPGY